MSLALLSPATIETLKELGLIAGGLVAAGVVYRYVVVGGWRLVRNVVRFFRKVSGYIERAESALALVERELRPNGGSTLRDAVNRIDARTEALEDWREGAERRLAMTEMIQAKAAEVEALVRNQHPESTPTEATP